MRLDPNAATAPGSLPWSWRTHAHERDVTAWPTAGRVATPSLALHRAVDVDTDPAALFRWLCQLRVAPYSYDWIDNRGHTSPRELTPGAEDLAVGQRLTVFRIAHVEPGVEITGLVRPRVPRLLGPIACTYRVTPRPGGLSRLLVRFELEADTRTRRLAALPLAWGDLVMMRKQLLTLKRLAEHQVARPPGQGAARAQR